MNILLASYGAAHVRMLLPLLPLFAERGHRVMPLALTTAVNAYRRAGVAHQRITDFVQPDAQLKAWAAPLLATHHNPAAGISEDESTAYLGASMRDLVAAYGEGEAAARYTAHGMNAFEPRTLARDIITASGADLVIATCSPRLERALLAEAVAMGIPSVCLMALFPLIGMEYLSKPDNGHLLFAGSARFKRQLLEHGRPEASVRIIGNPAFDLLMPPDASARRSALRQRRVIADDSAVILWAEQPEPTENAAWPVMLREAVCALAVNDARLEGMIRLHPSSQAGQAVTVADGIHVSSAEEDATDALLTADIVVTATSTIGYEAALMGKDVIVIRGSVYDRYADYCEEDGVMVIDDYTQLESAVNAYLTGDARAQRIRRYRDALPKPGHFAADTVETILSWCAESTPLAVGA